MLPLSTSELKSQESPLPWAGPGKKMGVVRLFVRQKVGQG